MQQMQQQMQQGLQFIQQLQGENQQLKMEMGNKQAEIAAKVQTARMEAEKDLQVAAMNNQADQQEIILKAYLDKMAQAAEQMRSLMTSQPQQSPNIVIHNAKPSRKTVAIQAPSGAVYQGVIEEQGESDEADD